VQAVENEPPGGVRLDRREQVAFRVGVHKKKHSNRAAGGPAFWGRDPSAVGKLSW
jgi:hypothetical protein